jgi:hypothetical protein
VRTRAAIVEAATVLFLRHGYQASSGQVTDPSTRHGKPVRGAGPPLRVGLDARWGSEPAEL